MTHIPANDTVYTVRTGTWDDTLQGRVVTVDSNNGREDDWGILTHDNRFFVLCEDAKNRTPWNLVRKALRLEKSKQDPK